MSRREVRERCRSIRPLPARGGGGRAPPPPPRPLGSARRAALVSLVVAATVMAAKWVAWRMTGSVVLLADGLESAVNVFAAIIAFVAIDIARRPPDEGHPFGHGKAEYFAAGIEGGLIAMAAVAIGFEVLAHAADPQPLEQLRAGLSISSGAAVVNLVLGLWLVRSGKRLRSPALVADGRHVLSDVVTTVGAVAGLAAAWVTGWWWLDPVLAVFVALNVLRVGVGEIRTAVRGLMDAGLPPAEMEELRALIEDHLGGALEAHDLRARAASDRVFVELHLVVPGAMTVSEAHSICDAMEAALEARYPGGLFTIHTEPEDEAHGHGGVRPIG